MILLDEAGMAGTLNLDRLVALAAEHGATVRLLGDHRQLGAVESGGALRLLVNEVGATELTTLHRFRQPREAEATLKLRDGDASALEFYQQHSRIVGGSREAMIEAAYEGWRVDMLAGKTSLMAAATLQMSPPLTPVPAPTGSPPGTSKPQARRSVTATLPVPATGSLPAATIGS